MLVSQEIKDLGRVHFIAIGGIGMSAIAKFFLGLGVVVTGSDTSDSEIIFQLRKLGAEIFIGHQERDFGDIDTVIVSSAIKDNNVELNAAKQKGLKILHRSEALAILVKNHSLVAVSGTHGKTTTSAMLTNILSSSGLDPNFIIGGIVAKLGTNAALGSSEVFVIEADESDGSFLNYFPDIAVITNIEADHLDHYGSEGAFQEAFRGFCSRVSSEGVLIFCIDDLGAKNLAIELKQLGREVVTYGQDEDADIRLINFVASSSDIFFSLDIGSDVIKKCPEIGNCDFAVSLSFPGIYNALNATAAIVASLFLGLSFEEAVMGVASFGGTKRRFEFAGEAFGVQIYDDYAHHPTEVEAVLSAVKEIGVSGQIWAVFQPHLYSRTQIFAKDFAAALCIADSVIVTDVYAARESPIFGVSGELIVDNLRMFDYENCVYVENYLDVAYFLFKEVKSGDLVITIGAGNIDCVGRDLFKFLSERNL